MKIVSEEKSFCPLCMTEHELQEVVETINTIFKGTPVEYDAQYFYCYKTDEVYANERQITLNDITMKDSYRAKNGLLTSTQITAIRTKYNLSQSDLCHLLNWEEDAIKRYESHLVQDTEHDAILRKLDADPEWFLQILHQRQLSDKNYTTGSNINSR